jgi:hypothetical protein
VADACRFPCERERLPLLCTTVKPPKLAGAALSGCPSDSAHNLKMVSRSNGSPLRRFSPSRTPSRTVALLPSPRHRGTCSAIEQENENLWRRACLKNRSAASDRDAVMEAERNAQTIVARTQIGSARGNTNGNLLHSYAAAMRAVNSTARK